MCYEYECDIEITRVQSRCNTLQHAATRCNTLQHVLMCVSHTFSRDIKMRMILISHASNRVATHCNTLQHTATHCNNLPHVLMYVILVLLACNQLGCVHNNPNTPIFQNASATRMTFSATYCSTLQHTATYCNTLQHTATSNEPSTRLL